MLDVVKELQMLRGGETDALPANLPVFGPKATVRAIRDAAARGLHEAKVSELSAQARERYADVLDRLGR